MHAYSIQLMRHVSAVPQTKQQNTQQHTFRSTLQSPLRGTDRLVRLDHYKTSWLQETCPDSYL